MKDNATLSRPFHKRSVYLDLKGSPHEATLAADLKILGAKMMPMFNKDVSCVVSNRVPLKTKSNYWTPPTPVSPLNEPSMHSPVSNSLAQDGNILPMSRGMALIQKATLKKSGTTDILDVCKRYGVKVYPIDKMLAKVKQLKIQFTSKFAAEKKKELEKKVNAAQKQKKLIAPFIKLEDNKRKYKTHYKEFGSWGKVINPELSKKICELKINFKGSGKLDNFARSALKELSANKPALLHKSVLSTCANSSKTVSIPKYSSFAKPSDYTSVYAAKKNPSNMSVKKHETKPKRKKRSYCEICSKNYTDLEEHLQSQKHKEFMSNPINYLSVQNIISTFPKGDAAIWEPCGEFLDFQSYLNDPPEIPMILEDELQMDFQTHYSNITDEDCDTIPYSFIDPGFVSQSVITPETKKLGFLQDSFKEKDVEPLESTENYCKNLVQVLGNGAMGDNISDVNGTMLQLLGVNTNISCPGTDTANISRELLLDMNTQMFNINGMIGNGCSEGIFNENLLYIENVEQISPFSPENIHFYGEGIISDNDFNLKYSGIHDEHQLKMFGFDVNPNLHVIGESSQNLFESYLNCTGSDEVSNLDPGDKTVVKTVLDTILNVIEESENPCNIGIGYTPKTEIEDRVLCGTVVENTDNIIKNTLDCILNVVELQENLGNNGNIDLSEYTPEAKSVDMTAYADHDLSFGKVEPTKGSKENFDVEIKYEKRDPSSKCLKDNFSAASLALHKSEPVDLKSSSPILHTEVQEFKVKEEKLGSKDAPCDLQASPTILVTKEQVYKTQTNQITNSDALPYVASNIKSEGIATEGPTIIQTELLSPSESSEELFYEEDHWEDRDKENEWQVLHSQVSNLCEGLNSSDER